MKLRCRLDGLVLPARLEPGRLIAWDGEECFEMGRKEAKFYEIIEATGSEWQELARYNYRVFRWMQDFHPPKPAIYPTNS